jgi:hypothetical protein
MRLWLKWGLIVGLILSSIYFTGAIILMIFGSFSGFILLAFINSWIPYYNIFMQNLNCNSLSCFLIVNILLSVFYFIVGGLSGSLIGLFIEKIKSGEKNLERKDIFVEKDLRIDKRKKFLNLIIILISIFLLYFSFLTIPLKRKIPIGLSSPIEYISVSDFFLNGISSLIIWTLIIVIPIIMVFFISFLLNFKKPFLVGFISSSLSSLSFLFSSSYLYNLFKKTTLMGKFLIPSTMFYEQRVSLIYLVLISIFIFTFFLITYFYSFYEKDHIKISLFILIVSIILLPVVLFSIYQQSTVFENLIQKEIIHEKEVSDKKIAEKSGDPKPCATIRKSYLRDNCYENVAEIIKDPIICNSIDDSKIKEQCFGNAQKELAKKNDNYQLCFSITRKDLRGDCFGDIANKAKDIQICDFIGDDNKYYKDKCYDRVYMTIAITSNEESVCANIIGKKIKDCYYQIALKKKDSQICNLIESDFDKKRCRLNVKKS